MRRVMKFSMVALAAAGVLAACGGGDPKTAPPIVIPKPDTSKPKPDVVVPDVDAGPPPEVTVKLLGVVGLDEFPGLFCGANMSILVGAENIGDRELRLFVPSKAGDVSGPVLGVAPTLESGSTDRYIFSIDGSKLALPGDGVPVEGGANLVDGKKFLLGVGVFKFTENSDGTTSVEYPTDETMRDEVEFTFDNTAPTLKITSPALDKSTPTMSGLQPVVGSVTDNQQVGRVEFYFNGELLTELEHAEDEKKSQIIDAPIDLRDELTAAADFEVRAYDACGLTATIVAKAKVIAHPFLRQFDRNSLPTKTSIADSTIVDWNGDTYPDVVLATTNGIVLALNDGKDAPGKFSDMRFVTTRTTQQVAVSDIDADGDLDIVAIQSVPGLGNALALHRQLPSGSLLLSESHALPIAGSTQVRDLLLADFTNDPPDVSREDIVVVTASQAESIVLFKRQRADQPQFSDQCELKEVTAGDAAGDSAVAADASPEYECKELFSAPTKAGGIEEIISVQAIDVTGDQGEPDGYLDLVVASENHNQVAVFTNRFFETNLLDTAFSQSTVSFVWPVTSSNAQDVRYFCLGNFIEEPAPGPDRLDLVAGTEQSGTWRVMRNVGDGKFQNSKGAGDPFELWNMTGTSNAGVRGIVCDDFDLDGHDDFALLSQSAQLLEVHLGNGAGRFNQVGDPDALLDQLQNPVNEGIGFVTGGQAQNLRVADFDQDGLPDIMMDFRDAGLGVFRNRTDTVQGFDLEATRALVTPLGKHSGDTGGQIQAFTVADITGDGKAEVIAATVARTYAGGDWLRDYHPLGQAYRNFLLKSATSPTLFFWTQGRYGEDDPSWPAAFDRFPPLVYPNLPKFAGPVTANRIVVLDLVSPGGEMKPDGKLDLMLAGSSGGSPQSVVSLYANTSSAKGFWDPATIQITAGALFSPINGGMTLQTAIQAFEMVPPISGVIPTLVVATNAGFSTKCDAPVPPMVRTCPWNPAKLCQPTQEEICPFWECWEPNVCPQDAVGKEFGGQAVAMRKIATEGPKSGLPDSNPMVKGNLMVLSNFSDSMTTYAWDKPDPVFPFSAPTTSSVGDSPKTFDVKDINNDGLLDFASSVAGNVMLAFGRTGLNPFESPLAIEPGVEQKGSPDGVVLSDVNADGFLDVVFVEAGRSQIAIYLAAGTDPNQEYLRQFHGPLHVPVCRTPNKILAHDFNGDGCETLLVQCSSVGAIATITNDTCARRAAGL
jgi:hypothetical protein